MKYYLIVGEASGDLHASNLMKALRKQDADAEFRFYGGDLMKAVGGTLVKHYREMTYMGIFPVLLHLRTILRNMKQCKRDVLDWQPDVLILVDYPGFNLKVARFVKQHSKIPIFYYIAPKIWAWKEYRIKQIRRDIDQLFSILPFEVDFFETKHHYPIHYVGNPSVDSVEQFKQTHADNPREFLQTNGLTDRPIIALLAGSRKQEIKDNLPIMLQAVKAFPHYQAVIAGAPGIDADYYAPFLSDDSTIVYGKTYELLSVASAALVTSGTATLETALFRVPQVVCYYVGAGKLVNWLRKHVLKVDYISLVNLILNKPAVCELVADQMTTEHVIRQLQLVLPDGASHRQLMDDYDTMRSILGEPGAARHAAQLMVSLLRRGTDDIQ